MAGMDALARKLAAQGMMGEAAGPSPANLELPPEDAGAGMPVMPEMDPAAAGGMDQESALGALEAAVESLPPDAAEKGRAHLQALRDLFGGEDQAAAPSEEPELPEEEA